MKILIAGGTGFIGSELSKFFSQKGFKVSILTRNLNPRKKTDRSIKFITDLKSSEGPYDVIINLSGEPLNKKRWNDTVKKNIYESRLQTTRKIIDYIKKNPSKPQVLISGSAVGFYGNHDETVFTENSAPADHGFTHTLCDDWEKSAMEASQYGVRVCLLRTGIVLGKNGGALKEMLLPFRLGLGAKLGSGKQWMSWIHMEDVVRIVDFLIQNNTLNGPFNLTAPGAVTNKEFSQILASTLHRPFFLRLPNFIVALIFGEMGETLLLKGQKVFPKKLIDADYVFKFPELSGALKNIFKA